jgi:predicted transcriptional regulator
MTSLPFENQKKNDNQNTCCFCVSNITKQINNTSRLRECCSNKKYRSSITNTLKLHVQPFRIEQLNIMLSSRCLFVASKSLLSRPVVRTSGVSVVTTSAPIRTMTSVKDAATADDALRFSGYSAIDFTIPEDAPVYNAVQKFAAFNIGCLVTVDAAGT